MPIPDGFKAVARVPLSAEDVVYLSVFRDAVNRAASALANAETLVASRYGDVSDHTRGSFVEGGEVVLCELEQDQLNNPFYRDGAVQGGARR